MPILLPRALLLAPMVELSHRPLRELVSSFGGCDRYYTEMTSASGFLSSAPFDRWFMDCEPEPERTVIQLYDADAEPLTLAAARIARERAESGQPLGGLDINFGCSAPQIEKAGGGVSWMKDPEAAFELMRGVREAIPGVTLSAKLRLGYEESEEAFLGFCRGLEAAGADYLVVHPRLKSEKFRRRGRWPYVSAAARALRIPVIGNGDIRSYGQYADAMASYGPAGVMIGREAARRPWIFALIRGREADDGFALDVPVMETGLRMFSLVRELLPKPFHASRIRRFFFYYCDNLSFGHHLRYAIQNATDLVVMENLFRAYFDDVPADKTITARE